MPRYVIVNADDFGASTGINRGIIDCHVRGILTSASLMVTGRAVNEAVSTSRDFPELSIGLHFDVWGEDEREFDISDHAALREEFGRQVDEFRILMNRDPTHIDTHRHVQRHEATMPVFQELVEPLGIPLRDDGQVRINGGFYAQWEWLVTELKYVSPEYLLSMLREAAPGWTEISCHPGFKSDDFHSVYHDEREIEVSTLTDPTVRAFIDASDIRLVSYHDFARLGSSKSLKP